MTKQVWTMRLAGVSGAATIVVALGASMMQDPGRPGRGDEARPAPPKGGGPGPGRFGPGGPGPGGFGPGTFLAPRIVELADADQDGKLSAEEAARAAEKFVREAAGSGKDAVDASALGRAINRKLGPPPGFGPGGDDEPPGDFGPGNFLGPQIIEAADADKDGKLSIKEAAAGAAKFVREAAGGKDAVDASALGPAMNRRLGPPPGFGPGGPGGPMGQERELVKGSDKDGDGRLNRAERQAARAALKKDNRGGQRKGFGPPGGFGPGRGGEPTAKPGPKVAKADVPAIPKVPLYDPSVVRTLFLDFEDADWEAEMAEFYKSDVEVPATLTVDGKTYPDVGVHFRGMSSFFAVRDGSKRSMNVSLDYVDPTQRLGPYKTLNLLNSHEDPTFLHTVLYFEVARHYIPAPKANYVRVVINGESWGLYVNAQQFDKAFLAENYPSAKGSRWKVPGSPGGAGGLDYLGEKVDDYKRRYQIKSEDGEKAWKDLIHLCRVLNETPLDRLEKALEPILDVDGALWFLALENALINGDGYWVRASDYSIFRDGAGKFHVIPHDANETFGPAMGPGMGGFPGMGGRGGFGRRGPGGGPGGGARGPAVDLDPLVGLDDASKPLRSRLLAGPSLRDRYLAHVRTIARDWLDWNKLGPVVEKYRALIEKDVEADTRKLTSFAAFQKATSSAVAAPDAPAAGRGRPPGMALREFAEKRRAYLLDHPAIKGLRP